jgi:hypothetical protein
MESAAAVWNDRRQRLGDVLTPNAVTHETTQSSQNLSRFNATIIDRDFFSISQTIGKEL